MRLPSLIVVVGLIAGSLAGPAFAGPVTGYFESEFSGAVLEGVWSESHDGGPGQLGNTIHAASLTGGSLATQWELSGPAIDAPPTLLADTVVGGYGMQIWLTTYVGGTLTLTDQGPWWNAGDAGTSYDVALTDYTHNTTYTIEGGVVEEVSTTVQMRGTFVDYPNYEVSFVVAQALQAGQGSVLPAGYPSWVTPSGAVLPWSPEGAWGVAQKIRMEIVPEPATIGLLIAGLSGLTLRRRRR